MIEKAVWLHKMLLWSKIVSGLVQMVSLNYIILAIATLISSIGWFVATETNDLLALMPTWVIWCHHTIGVLCYVLPSSLPIMAGGELVMAYLITCLSLYLDRWSTWLKDPIESISRAEQTASQSAGYVYLDSQAEVVVKCWPTNFKVVE